MNPRYEKFLKPTGRKRDLQDHDLFAPPEVKETTSTPTEPEVFQEPASFYEIFRDVGNKKWVSEQNHPPARASFNVFNLTQHPDRDMASGLAVCVLKGTTFEDKANNCLEEARALEGRESDGEVELRPDPENPYDPYALAVISKKSGKHLGFIPRAADANKHYTEAMKAGRLTGAYLIEAKRGNFKNGPSVMLFVATGWKTAEEVNPQ